VTVAWEIVTTAVPVFVRVSVCGLLEPVATFPKLKFVALAASVAEEVVLELVFASGVLVLELVFASGVLALVKPMQPERLAVISRAARTTSRSSGLCCFGSLVVTR
jgi:hypothetical protein